MNVPLRLDPEDCYFDVLAHAQKCPTCWPWRNTLWHVNRLCGHGRALMLIYAKAELGDRLRLEPAS